MLKKNSSGFTLIEVLIALVIIAIALTALIKASSQNVVNTMRLKDKIISHWVQEQGLLMIRLGLIPLQPEQLTYTTVMLNERWYWRKITTPTRLPNIEKITVTVAKDANGAFISPLESYRLTHEK